MYISYVFVFLACFLPFLLFLYHIQQEEPNFQTKNIAEYTSSMFARSSRVSILRNGLIVPPKTKLSAHAAVNTLRFQSSYASITKIINVADFESAVNQKELSVFDFYATWCGPCKAMAPHLSKLTQEYPDVNFYKVDVDESSDIAKRCEVTAMPTFVFAKDGKLLGKVVGANPNGLEKGIKDLT